MLTGTSLIVATFLALRNTFFDADGPRRLLLPPRGSDQVDPFDRFVVSALNDTFVNNGEQIVCQGSSKPLVSPDCIVINKSYVSQATGDEAVNGIFGLEIKRIGRKSNDSIVRRSGLDYSSTPPCGIARVQRIGKHEKALLEIPNYYLFVCLEHEKDNEYIATAVVMCTGDLINANRDLYWATITGSRSRHVGIGSYGDGMDRQRPMFVFANPLAATELDRHVTLILNENDCLGQEWPEIAAVHTINRSLTSKDTDMVNQRRFRAYRAITDLEEDPLPFVLQDPFPMPRHRQPERARGSFVMAM
jgi:hypothetical protein